MEQKKLLNWLTMSFELVRNSSLILHMLVFDFFSNYSSLPHSHPPPHPQPRPLQYIFAICTETDNLNTNIPISKFQELDMRKIYEKHVKKDIYIYIYIVGIIGSIVH